MKGSGQREHWTGSLGFILAASGSAIGLGNIWRFPYVTGENGGGAFVLVYLLCIAAIGLPVMLCEITLGRHTQRNPIGAFKILNPRSSHLAHLVGLGLVLTGLGTAGFGHWGWALVLLGLGAAVFRYRWTVVGAMGVLTGVLILSFYSVVAGWTLGYLVQAASGQLEFGSVEMAGEHFGSFVGQPAWPLVCHLVFMSLCVAIVFKGIRNGIERWSRILMPLLLVILVVLILRGLTLPGALEGVRFFLSPDFSKIDTNSILVALGMAFFSLSLGMGAITTYGSYLGKEENLFKATLSIIGLDTLMALLAGLAMFPAVFALGFSPEVGPGLVFQVLPAVFARIPLGALWATLFFLLLLLAALTSGISLLEVVTAYYVDERRWPRGRAAVVFGSVIFAVGALCAVSVTGWQNLPWLRGFLVMLFGTVRESFFDCLDYLTNNWMLPLGGLFTAIFVGWIWGTRRAVEEIRHGSDNFADVHLLSFLAGLKEDPAHQPHDHPLTLASLWGIFVRFISPVAVILAFMYTIGWLDYSSPSVETKEPPAEAEAADD